MKLVCTIRKTSSNILTKPISQHLSKIYMVILRIVLNTVQPVLSSHSKIDKTLILMTNGSLVKVESIAECFPWSILQYF